MKEFVTCRECGTSYPACVRCKKKTGIDAVVLPPPYGTRSAHEGGTRICYNCHQVYIAMTFRFLGRTDPAMNKGEKE